MPPDYTNSPSPSFPAGPAQPGPAPDSYNFILNPEKAVKPPVIPGQSSVLMRTVVVLGGFLVILILFIVVKGLIVKGPDLSGYVTIAQDQESIITLITNAFGANQLSALPTSDQNLAATAQLALTSNQGQVLTYLKRNGHSISSTALSKDVSASIGTQLNNSVSAGDYSSVFQSLLTTQFNTYINDINKTYPTSGKNGKVILRSLYTQAELMVSELS